MTVEAKQTSSMRSWAWAAERGMARARPKLYVHVNRRQLSATIRTTNFRGRETGREGLLERKFDTIRPPRQQLANKRPPHKVIHRYTPVRTIHNQLRPQPPQLKALLLDARIRLLQQGIFLRWEVHRHHAQTRTFAWIARTGFSMQSLKTESAASQS